MNSENTPIPGVSGKKFAIALVSSMIVVGGSLAYLLAIYEQLDRARAKSAEHWRIVASQLDNDYKRIETLDSNTPQLETTWLKSFQQGADQFRTATNVEEQLRLARSLESQLQSKNQSIQLELPPSSEELRQEIKNFNASLSTERDIQQSLAGQMVQFFIRHPVRENLEFAR